MPRFPRNYLKTSFFHVMSQGINKNFRFEDSIYKKIDFIDDEECVFIDVEEDKEIICEKLVKEFLNKKKMKMEEVRENKAELKKLIKILKQHKIAFRTISKTININREKLRREYNKE